MQALRKSPAERAIKAYVAGATNGLCSGQDPSGPTRLESLNSRVSTSIGCHGFRFSSMSSTPSEAIVASDDAPTAAVVSLDTPQEAVPTSPTDSADRVPAAPAPTVDEVSEPLQPEASTVSEITEPEVDPVSSDPTRNPPRAETLPEPISTIEILSTPSPPSPRTPKNTHFADLHPATSSTVPVQARRSVSRRTSASAPKPRPSLRHTAQDLRNLLKTFLLILPSRLRSLRVLIPGPFRRLASAIINQLAMVLHSRGALASSMFYDMLVMIWKTVITLFFREIRSRGAWKVPGDGEGAVIFVVGPHHNQVSI